MDSTYTPHSPDLSSFISSSPKAQKFNKTSLSRQPYAPRSPTLSYSDINSFKSNFQYVSNSHAPNYIPNPNSDINSPNHHMTSEGRQVPHSVPTSLFPDNRRFISPSQRQYSAFAPAQASSRSNPHVNSQDLYLNQGHINIDPEISPKTSIPWAPTRRASTSHPTMSSSRGTKEKIERRASSNITSYPQYADPNPLKIEIKTKFPVARIKRIMQADEEVGKVAQVTPVAVSKALELFMIALVTGSADKAREKGSKKVNAQHLKMVVDGQPERFDFLAEIVGKVGESSDGVSGEHNKAHRKRKEESESASEEEKEKVKKKGRGRKKV